MASEAVLAADLGNSSAHLALFVEGRIHEQLRVTLAQRQPNQIATEDDAEAINDLVEHLQEVKHPALEMEALL